ncbi:hypothetical protein C2E23DRAFT_859409 [Lenzites betulinus]|nr:hypothetical protein C2E23DRAFT_859409 [Lenzites betulinus]
MARDADSRVKDIVDEELLLLDISWRAELHKCVSGAGHLPIVSYGGSTYANAGLVFEVCCARTSTKCLYHKKPLLPDRCLSARLKIWTRIADLHPPPHGNPMLGAEAVVIREDIRDEINGHAVDGARNPTPRRRQPGGILSQLLASSPGSSNTAISRGSSRASRSSSASAPLGRPPLGVCEVIVYAYVTGKHNPMVIRASGTPRDEVVEFTFGQPAVFDALHIKTSDRPKPKYAKWHLTASNWSAHPKSHQATFIAPGERVLYRELEVANPPNLDAYLALLLPPAEGPDTRPILPTVRVPSPKPRLRYKYRRSSPVRLASFSPPSSPSLRSFFDDIRYPYGDEVSPSAVRKRSASSSSRPSPAKRARQSGISTDSEVNDTAARSDLGEGSSSSVSGIVSVPKMGAGGWKGKGKAKAVPSPWDVIELSD